MSGLEFTGERFVPGARGEIWVEHWHRYHFARLAAPGKRVVDAACGEGYGSALLATVARHVTGADIEPAAIAHARATYGDIAHLAFAQAPCTDLPLAEGAADLFVSFETIEHIHGQEAFVDEIARVLAPEGVLLLSCPNRREYSDRRGFRNEFHVKELDRDELAALLARRFPHVRWFGQRPSFFSVIAPEAGSQAGQFVEVGEHDAGTPDGAFANPLYFIVAASRSAEALAALPAPLSVLSDRDEWVHRDYEKVMRELGITVARGEALERQVAEREAGVQSLSRDAASAREEAAAAAAALAEAREHLAGQRAALEAKDAEILRRRGVRWWLRLPFVRLGLLDE